MQAQEGMDQVWMDLAIDISKEAIGLSSPNPPVGAVVVKNGKVIGKGFTQRPGEAHAEVMAIDEAGADAAGATLYVTLEPCSFVGRTPACTTLIISKKIARVVMGSVDPHPQVSGEGMRQLREQGIQVDLLQSRETECRSILFPFFSSLGHNESKAAKPEYIMKAALTLDGFMATSKHASQWISHPYARLLVHRLRALSDAVLIGDGTAVRDNPSLTVRLDPEDEAQIMQNVFYPGGVNKKDSFVRILLNDRSSWALRKRNPVRIILDPALQTPRNSLLFQTALTTPTWVFISSKKEKNLLGKMDRLSKMGVKIFSLPPKGRGVDLNALNEKLLELGIIRVLVEGGPQIHKAFLEENYYDRFFLFYSPKFIKGADGFSLFAGRGVKRMEQAYRLPNPRMVTIPGFHNAHNPCFEKNFLVTGAQNSVYRIS